MGILGLESGPSPVGEGTERAAESFLGEIRSPRPRMAPSDPEPTHGQPGRVSGHAVVSKLPEILAAQGIQNDGSGQEGQERQLMELAKYSVGVVKSVSELASLLAQLMGYAEQSGFEASRLSQINQFVRMGRIPAGS